MGNFDNDINELYKRLDLYIMRNYEHPVERRRAKSESGGKFMRKMAAEACCEAEPILEDACFCRLPNGFEDAVLDRLEDSFGTLLVKTINKKGLVNADVYKDANIDRRLFSKIISNEGYSPTKGTVLALAIALKLNSTRPHPCSKVRAMHSHIRRNLTSWWSFSSPIWADIII